MKIFKIILIFIFASQFAQAGTVSGDTTQPAPAGPSVNQNANNAQSSNDSGSAMSMVMGAGLTAMGVQQIAAKNYATGAMMIGMGILSFIQSGEHGDKANGANTTANNTNAGPSETLKPLNPANFGSFNKDIATLKKGIGGVKADFTKGTVTVGDKTYPASDFSSAASMQAAGFNPDQVAAVMDAAAKAEKKIAAKMGAATATNGFDEGGGGGGSGITYVDEAPAGAVAVAGASGLGDPPERGPAGVAGMTKDFNGEPIGVAGDSIFEMMNRRYILKDKQNAFINETDLLLRQK